MSKDPIRNAREKQRILDAFIEQMSLRRSFIVAGHKNPDEDCIASMVAFSLLLTKFAVKASIVCRMEHWEKFPFLRNICKYNSIDILGSVEELEQAVKSCDALVTCDTPKPVMIDFFNLLEPLMNRKDMPVLEIDHHLEADSAYIGDPGLCLVDQASSSCELIGMLGLRMQRHRQWRKKLEVPEVFTRNFVLCVITGIVGDSRGGQYLSSRREKRYYRYFSRLFNRMLIQKTDKDSGNFANLRDILNELEKLTGEEECCYNDFLPHKHSRAYISWIALDKQTMDKIWEKYDDEVVVTMAKYAANVLAEESGCMGLFAYWDHPRKSDLVQLRLRRSQDFKALDLRDVLTRFHIENGGGHEGAIGFRLPQSELRDFPGFIDMIVDGTNQMAGEAMGK